MANRSREKWGAPAIVRFPSPVGSCRLAESRPTALQPYWFSMAPEPERSENMSAAPSSSESTSSAPAPFDVGADAALILAALGRMEAVVRNERAAFDRLRVLIADMAQA